MNCPRCKGKLESLDCPVNGEESFYCKKDSIIVKICELDDEEIESIEDNLRIIEIPVQKPKQVYDNPRCPICGKFGYKHTEKDNLECERAFNHNEMVGDHF